MAEDDIQDVRRQRLIAFAQQHGSDSDFKARFGLKQSHMSFLSQIRSGYSFGEKAARNWEQRLRLVSGYLDQRDPAPPGVAHEVNLQPLSIPPLLAWETLGQMTTLPEKFALELRDQAMAPKLPRGAQAEFVRRSTAEVGQVVLVRAAGDYHVRRLKLQADGRTVAAPSSDMWPTFESFEVVAVAVRASFDMDLHMQG